MWIARRPLSGNEVKRLYADDQTLRCAQSGGRTCCGFGSYARVFAHRLP